MAWPLSQDYNEAVQSPARHFADPNLRGGKAVVNELGLPLPYSGNFADVYQVRGSDGVRWAVKCFTREVGGLRERYHAISAHLRAKKLPIAVDFSYLEEGIRVGSRWYPVLKMQWVEGLTLNQFVGQNADRPVNLEALLQIWSRVAASLRTAELAHADLQHGNVLLVPGASANSLALKLVDYDGMFVPALAGRQSGEVGHPSYQHPERARTQAYGPEVDRFPLLLIATALRAVTVGGRALWDRFDNGDNLLFQEADLLAPTKSLLFYELTKSADPLTAALTDHLLKALRGGLASVPLLHEVLPEARPAPSPPRVPRPAVVATPIAVVPTGTLVAVMSAPVSIINRPRRQYGRKRGGAWVAVGVVAAVVLVSLLTMGPLMRMGRDRPGDAAPKRPKGEGPQLFAKGPEKKDGRPIDLKASPIKDGNTPGPKKSPGIPKEVVPPPVVVPPPPKGSGVKSIHNSIDMKLVWIHAGKFLMGSSDADVKRVLKEPNKGYFMGDMRNETPQHEVSLTKPFYMGAYEVTQAEYQKVMKVNPSHFAATGKGKDQVKGINTSNFPVETVSWGQAVEFCNRLTERPDEQKARRVYRLPTDAEWEYACRAGTTTLFHYGDTLSAKEANIKGLEPFGPVAKMPGPNRTVKVGSYAPNAWGLYDMHGNVWEWCLDGERPYTPKAVADPRGPDNAKIGHVLRGGSWGFGAWRSAFHKARPYHNQFGGFRVVCEVSAPELHAGK